MGGGRSRLRKITQTNRLSAIGMAIGCEHIRPDPDRRPARQDHRERRQADGMEEQVAMGLSAPRPRHRCFDRLVLSLRDQHALDAPGACGLVRRRRWKDTVSRVWRKVKGYWDAWNAHSLKDEPIIRLFLDGTVVRVRLDRKSTLLVARVI